jgi:hypothetical protein
MSRDPTIFSSEYMFVPWCGRRNLLRIFAVGDIYRGEQILTATHPFRISLEQTGSRCYNCSKDLGHRGSNIHSFDCCPKKRFCGVTCQQNAELYYHKALCGKDFIRLEDKAQAVYGGKKEDPLLKKLVDWEDKAEGGYPREGELHISRQYATDLDPGICNMSAGWGPSLGE